MDRAHVLKIDELNLRLKVHIVPTLLQQGVEFERSKFQEHLQDGALTLEHTTRWMQLIYHKEVNVLKAVDRNHLLQGIPAAYVHLHASAILALVLEQPNDEGAGPLTVSTELANMIRYSDDRTCPETLLLDATRLRKLRNEFRHIVRGTTLLLTARQVIRNAGFSLVINQHTMERIGETLAEMEPPGERDANSEFAVINGPIKHILEFESALSDTTQALLLRSLLKCAAQDDPVHVLM